MQNDNELNRRRFLKCANMIGLSALLPPSVSARSTSNEPSAQRSDAKSTQGTVVSQANEASPDTILLKDYRPKSIYKIPVTQIDKAKHPIIDMHSHPYAKTPQQIEKWLKNMDECGIQKTMILTMTTGPEFDEIYRKYSKYPDRFEVWCGLDFSSHDKPGFGPAAVKDL